MKKIFTSKLLLLALVCTCGASTVKAEGVYQLQNSNFSEWDYGFKIDGTPSTVLEPNGWNSFGTGVGSVIGMATNYPTQATRLVDGVERPYVSIKSKVVKIIVTIVANGTLTTGRINAASATAADASKNYNYTPVSSDEAGADNFRHQFTGRPDSLVVFLQYIPENQNAADIAQISAWIHNNSGDFQDPVPAAKANDTITNGVAHALINPNATEARNDFKRFSAPFRYDAYEGGEPAYMLFTATTNKTPGGKGGNDELRLDSVQMIYLSCLSEIKINGEAIDDFDENVTTYNFEGAAPELSAIEVSKKGKGGLVEKTTRTTRAGDEVTTITITVKGDDHTDETPNITSYDLVYTLKNSVGIGNIAPVKETNIYTSNGQVYVNDYTGLINIYNLHGMKITGKSVDGNSSFELPKGAYIVQTDIKSETIVIK